MLCRSRIPPRALERLVLAVGLFVAGCGTLPTAGPTARQVVDQESHDGEARFTLIEIDGSVVAARLAARKDSLRDRFPRHGAPPEPKIGIGDSLVITLWEAAGGGLFTASASDHIVSGSHSVTLPEQAVARDGAISVPFAGRIRAAGRLPLEVQYAIERRLSGKAIEPQAIVTLTKSVSNTATVSGEVVSGARVALSLKGDRLLDLVASAGGTRSPVYET
jgi:polysaccharide export outer membrane protein